MGILTEHQQQKLYGQIRGWALLNRDEQLSINQNIAKPKAVLSGQLGLMDEQFNQLYCIGINNQIIRSMRLRNPTSPIDEIASLQQITPCILRMLDQQITDQEQIVEWAKLALMFGVNFDLVPFVQNRIQKLTHKQDYYPIYQELKQLSQQEWQALAKEGIDNE